MADRKSFIMYMSWMPMLKTMPSEQLGELMKAVAFFQTGEEYEITDPMIAAVWNMIREVMEEDAQKYEETCAKRAEAGSVGGKQRVANASKDEADSSTPKQNQANATDNKNKTKTNTKNDLEDKKIIAPSPSSEPASDLEPIPLNDGSEWTPTESEAEEYARLYPAVDLGQEFRNMRGWCTANPSRKKTLRGVRAFVNTWLSKEQNRGRPTERTVANGSDRERKRNSFSDMEEHDHDIAALERELLLRTIRGA